MCLSKKAYNWGQYFPKMMVHNSNGDQNPVQAAALQIAKILMEKLHDTFSKMFVSITATQASSREKDNDSISGASFHRKHYQLRSGNLNPDESLLDDLKIPNPVNVSGPPCFVETPTVNSSIRSSVSSAAKTFKD